MEGGVLVQRSMGPRLIIVGSIRAYDSAQVRLTEHDHVVQAFPADRADESLNIRILPGRSGRDRPVANAHGAQTLHEDWAIRGVPIPNEVTRCMVPRERIGDLARNPLRARVCRHAERNPKSTSMTQNDKTIEDLERDRRQDKEIDCRNAVDVVAQKRPPALGRWPRATAHVPSDRRLSDLEAKLEQFTMNVWRTPEWVRTTHLTNELA